MQTNQLEHEYDSVASEFGRRVANRWAHAELCKAGKREGFELSDFYAMYGSEESLPEHERTRPGDETLLDISQWNAFYRTNPWAHNGVAWKNPLAKGRAHWMKELYETVLAGEPGRQSIHYVAWLVTLTQAEVEAEYERLNRSDDATEQEWAKWIVALEEEDAIDIWMLIYQRHPSPNFSVQSDAQVKPYNIGIGPIPNEQTTASMVASAMGNNIDYSNVDFGSNALWNDGRTDEQRADEAALKLRGERTQAKIDRKTNKGVV
ncbi:hypothetical protein [Paraburkholderia sp. D1E]|uniref:hypothetical protein n=1 Tax=Paraburkholderia sp. D1E TaxID=3461398 RepID=UPI0040451F5D